MLYFLTLFKDNLPMLSDQQVEDFRKTFPALGEDTKLLAEIRSNAVHVQIPLGYASPHIA
ncbi:MAG TPA: hypothetical protein EYH06_08705 [Chromatiales bacterium]|nr:hypothetical protein [Thiotrichales bacterium]HIP68655.1 hypothetical protein [Chromatiales bacterium]